MCFYYAIHVGMTNNRTFGLGIWQWHNKKTNSLNKALESWSNLMEDIVALLHVVSIQHI